MKLLIDTNIVLDAFANREPFAEMAKSLILKGAENTFSLYITATSVTDIYYILNRHYHEKKTCNTIMEKVLSIFAVADVIESDCKRALVSVMNDYEDAVLAESAKRNKISYIVTRNTKDFKDSAIKAVTPEELLELLKNS